MSGLTSRTGVLTAAMLHRAIDQLGVHRLRPAEPEYVPPITAHFLAADATPDLRRAAGRMASDPEKYRAMNPPNGWGDYEGARDYLTDLLEGCLAHPKTTIYVSR